MTSSIFALAAAASLGLAAPAFAQEVAPPSTPGAGRVAGPGDAPSEVREETAYDGDYLTIGLGAVFSPSYLGSDDYVLSPLPLVQGSYGGVDVDPRGAGLAFDFIPDRGDGPGFDLGVVARLRSDRAARIEDEVVDSLGDLDRAIEVGPTVGVSFPGLLNPFDSLTVSGDVTWDVNGAHDGMVVTPSVSYFTPLSRGMAASLSLSAEIGDGDFNEYYFRVTGAQSAATGGVLPAYFPDGGDVTSAGGGLLLLFDLNGELADGGWLLAVLGSYSRALGDAKDTPYTSVRGSADQFLVGAGVGYTF